jgi:hypothetical protein
VSQLSLSPAIRVSKSRSRLTVSAILYKSLGIGSHSILALAAAYGTIAFLSNALTTKYLTDQWGRRKYVSRWNRSLTFSFPFSPSIRFALLHMLTSRTRMIITGLAGIVLIEIYAAVMQRVFQNTDNRVGKGFAILGIYLFVVCYCEFDLAPLRTLGSRRKGGDGRGMLAVDD